MGMFIDDDNFKYPSGYLLENLQNLLSKNVEVDSPAHEPDPIVDLELVLQHCKGDEVEDCTMILYFLGQHSLKEIDQLLLKLNLPEYSLLGVTAVLRYTNSLCNELKNWHRLRDHARVYLQAIKSDIHVLHGLLDL